MGNGIAKTIAVREDVYPANSAHMLRGTVSMTLIAKEVDIMSAIKIAFLGHFPLLNILTIHSQNIQPVINAVQEGRYP